MKISQNTSLPLDLNAQAAQLRRAQANGLKSADKSTDPDTNPNQDEVRISQQAKSLAIDSSAAADNARQQKVDALKRSIESGTYRVEPEKVAKAMISELAPAIRNRDEGQQ